MSISGRAPVPKAHSKSDVLQICFLCGYWWWMFTLPFISLGRCLLCKVGGKGEVCGRIYRQLLLRECSSWLWYLNKLGTLLEGALKKGRFTRAFFTVPESAMSCLNFRFLPQICIYLDFVLIRATHPKTYKRNQEVRSQEVSRQSQPTSHTALS